MMDAVRGAGALFPLPLVESPHAASSRSRRVQQRARRALLKNELANAALRALNILHTSFSSHIHSQSRNPSHIYSKYILRSIVHVQSCAERFVSRLAPCSMDLSDDFVFQDLFDPSHAAYSSVTESLPLSADRISLPSEPGSADLLDILPPDVARVYEQPNPDLFRPVAERKRAPYVCRVESPADYVKIIQRLQQINMVSFTTSPKIVNGCFGTAKSDGSQRFVFDGRPVNAAFVTPPKVDLPCPDLLSKLIADSSEPIYVAKADLDNYYHRLRVPTWLHEYFALPSVKASEVGLGGEYGDATLVYPCCTTLPMGWTHSVYLSQTGHEHIVSTQTTLQDDARISPASDFRLDRERHGIYIDDLFLLAPEHLLPGLHAKLDRYIEVMTKIGLPPKPSKVVRPSADGVVCIGMEIHGRDKTVGGHPQKVQALVQRTRDLVRGGSCSGLLMSRIVGLWSWFILARRAAFAVFNNVYRYIEVAGAKVFVIWPTVAAELLVICDVAPLLFSNIGAHWFLQTVATDASDTGLGVVAARCDADRLETMSNVRPPIPVDNRSHSEVAAAAADLEQKVDRSLHPTLSGLKWVEIVASYFRYPEHINVLEVRALTTGVRWVSSFPQSVGSRLVLWCDSLVVVFSVRKGRSSSPELLRRLRALSAHLLATGIQVYCNWIPTEVNPADGPSRRYKFDSTLGFPGEGPGRADFLVRAAYSKQTIKRYDAAVHDFVAWMDKHGEDPESTEEMDEVLCDYFHDLFVMKGGKCRSNAACTIAGVQMRCPQMKRRLTSATLALKGWEKLVPSVPYPPLTWDLAVCVAVHMSGNTSDSSHGLAVLLAFDCYLRVGELVGLRRCDVADTGDVRMGSAYRGMSLRLARTKTGRNQWVTVRHPHVIFLMRRLIRRMKPSEVLFSLSAAAFRRRFKMSCADLGLSPDYVPHSLRHGGATHDHLLGRPLEEILRHGRWASVKSARHYVQSGRALLLTCRIPADIADLGRILSADVRSALSLSQRH